MYLALALSSHHLIIMLESWISYTVNIHFYHSIYCFATNYTNKAIRLTANKTVLGDKSIIQVQLL